MRFRDANMREEEQEFRSGAGVAAGGKEGRIHACVTASREADALLEGVRAPFL